MDNEKDKMLAREALEVLVTQEDQENEKRSIWKNVRDYVFIVLTIVVLFTVFIFVTFVDGNSMNDTYRNGQMLLCRRIIAPKAKEVVVFTTPAGDTLIKRVIAVGGETVNIDFEKGEVYVNGELLDESYIKEPTTLDEEGFEYPITVPEGSYFVMGDNRNDSRDSRDASVGFVSKSQIKGTVMFAL